MLLLQFIPDKSAQAHHREHRQGHDEVRREPVLLLSFVQHDLQRTDPHRQQTDAVVIHCFGFARDVWRIKDVGTHHKGRHHADGQIDVEQPAPGIAIGDPSAQHGSEHRRHHDAERPECHGFAAALGRKSFEQDGLREWLQSSAGRALYHAKDDKHGKVRRNPTKERGDGEARDREQQQPFAAKVVRQPSGHRQDDGIGDKIRGEHPCGFVGAGGEIASHVRQRDIHHRGIQHLHEGA